MKPVKIFILASFFPVFCVPAQAEYSDQIAAPFEEVWKAAREVLRPYGLAREDEKRKILKTRWNEERVERSRGKVSDFIEQVKPDYLRRSQFQISFVEEGGGMRVRVRGRFQEKRTGLPPAAPWRPLKPKLDEERLEKDIFLRILGRIEHGRRQAL